MLNENQGPNGLEPAPDPTPTIDNNGSAPDLGLPIKTPVLDKEQPSFEFNKKKKGKIKLILIIVLVLLVIGGGGYFTYSRLYNPKNIFKKVITNATESATNLLSGIKSNEIYDKTTSLNTISLKGTLDEDKGYTTTQEIAFDMDNNVSISTTTYQEGEKILGKLIEANQDNYLYRFLDGNLDKPIRYEGESSSGGLTNGLEYTTVEDFLKRDSVDDATKVIQKLSDIFVSTLEDLKYEKSSEKTEIGDDTVSVNKISIQLNEENLQIMLDAFAKKTTEDDELLDVAVAYSELIGLNLTKKELIDQIESFADNADLSDIEDGSEINVYTEGVLNKFVKFEVVVEDETIFYYADYKDIETYWIADYQGEENFVLTIDNTEDDSTFAINVMGKEVVTGTIKEFDLEKELVDITFKFNIDDLGASGTGSIKMTSTTINVSLNVGVGEEEIAFTFALKEEGNNKYSINLEGSYLDESINLDATIELGAKVNKLAINGYYEPAEITDVMQSTIIDNFMANIVGTAFETELNSNASAGFQDLKTYLLNGLQDKLYLNETIIEDKNYEEVYDENHHSIFDAAQCDNVYDDGYGNWYNYDNDGTYEYVGKGEMIDSICQYNNSY